MESCHPRRPSSQCQNTTCSDSPADEATGRGIYFPPVEQTRVTPNTTSLTAGSTPSYHMEQSFLNMISDLTQGLSLSVLATLTHQLVANFGFFLTGSYRPSAVLKHVIFLIAYYGCTAKEDLQAKLCGWPTGTSMVCAVRGRNWSSLFSRKTDICLLNETQLREGESFRMAN